MKFILLFITFFSNLFGVEFNKLADSCRTPHPFPYDLGIVPLPGAKNENVMIHFHGYGSSGQSAKVMRSNPLIKRHIVGFNFPDYSIFERKIPVERSAYGTIQELLPALFVIKQCMSSSGCGAISLHGFSAGGASVINVIAALASNRYDSELAALGINKKETLEAIQKGIIILEVPVKSFEEIALFNPYFSFLAERYKKNGMEPIDALANLKEVPLNILIHFQKGDKSLSNRDDGLYIEKVFEVNKNGNTVAVLGDDGGHLSYHASLWKVYPKFCSNQIRNKVLAFDRQLNEL
jgi:hypothetical protein